MSAGGILRRMLLLAGLLLASAAQAAGAAALLPFIDARLAEEEALLAPQRLEPLWIDAHRFLLPRAKGSLSIDLVDARTGTRRAVADDRALAPALVALGLDPARFRPRGLDAAGLQLSDGTRWFRAGADGLAEAPELAERDRLERPQLIGSQFPTTFDDLVELPAPDGKRFLTLAGHDLALRGLDGQVRRLTTDGSALKTWRSSEESAQGFPAAWSPDGRWIAAVRLDLEGVPHEPLMRWLATPPTIDRVPYPRAGEPMPRFEVALIDPRGGAPRLIDLGDTRDHYVNIIGFTADSRRLLVQATSRAHRHWRLLAVAVETGVVTQLLEERRATYIDTPMTLAPVLVRPVAGGLLHLSEADGYRHILLYDDTGRRVRQLTRGRWVVEDIVAIDAKEGWVYFLADRTPGIVLAPGLHRVRLQGGAVQPIGGAGVERLWLSPGLDHVVLRRSAPDRLPVTELVSTGSGKVQQLSGPAEAGLAALPAGRPISVPSVDGRFAVTGVLYMPQGAAGKVPVVEILYGGMQLDFVPRAWFGFGRLEAGYNGLIARLLLARGFAVAYINAPGTPNRGRAYQDATHGIWPQTVMPNHAAWWREAARIEPRLDLSRLGVFGNSWGGYLAQRAMIEAPDLYRAAVAMAPPSDLVDHPNYIEPFMGLPAENPAGYAAASNLARVGEIRGPVLVMPMPLDVNAGFSPGMKFVDAMVQAGRDVELFTLPEVNHRVTCCGWPRERYAYATVIDFLERKLHD